MKTTLKSILKSFLSRYQTLHLEYPVDMKPRYGYGLPAHPKLLSILENNRTEYIAWLNKALSYKNQLVTITDQSKATDSFLPSWNNGFLPGLDIVMLYTILASTSSSTYIEVGSGNSTKVAAKAIADQKLPTRIISLDPSPRAEIDRLSDTIIRQPLEKTDLTVFANLKQGDIVFIDNSHRIFPNSDATVFFMDILPSLAPGVIVHIHDIFLPFDYPQFMCDRYYSEQYALAFFLLANPEKYHTMMPNFFVSEDPELQKILEPLWSHPDMPAVEKHGGSFWLKIAE